jgi:hypothetical protein
MYSLSGQYAARNIHAIDPATLLRAHLQMLQVWQTSLTKWVDEMRRYPSLPEPRQSPPRFSQYDHVYFPKNFIHVHMYFPFKN